MSIVPFPVVPPPHREQQVPHRAWRPVRDDKEFYYFLQEVSSLSARSFITFCKVLC
jgi:hypothetical protein